MHKKLTIVSDTSIFLEKGNYYAFGPVVNELESFEHLFDEIIWIGYNQPEKRDDLSMKIIVSNKIKVVLLKKVGGKTLLSSLNILFRYPLMFFIILKNILKSDVIHTRAPSHPAFIAGLISFILRKKIWWHKFAGSWDPSTLPFFYKLQRKLLIKAKHTSVTINGFWRDQPSHCFSFENPCLTEKDILKGQSISEVKFFEFPFVFCFVGRIDEAKGILNIIKALKKISPNSIEKIHFVGDGSLINKCKDELNHIKDKVVFHGFLDKNGVHEIFEQSHFLLLPSKSEGFPKVIAESACYGVLPVVSNVGSIGHYINEDNGFVWNLDSKNEEYHDVLKKAIITNSDLLKQKSNSILKLAKRFTFDIYYKKLLNEIFMHK